MGLTFKELKWFVEEYKETFPDESEICLLDADGDPEQAEGIRMINEMDVHFRMATPKILIKKRGN